MKTFLTAIVSVGTFLAAVASAIDAELKLSDLDARAVREMQLDAATLQLQKSEAQRQFDAAERGIEKLEKQFRELVDRLRPKNCPGCTLDSRSLEWKKPEPPAKASAK